MAWKFGKQKENVSIHHGVDDIVEMDPLLVNRAVVYYERVKQCNQQQGHHTVSFDSFIVMCEVLSPAEFYTLYLNSPHSMGFFLNHSSKALLRFPNKFKGVPEKVIQRIIKELGPARIMPMLEAEDGYETFEIFDTLASGNNDNYCDLLTSFLSLPGNKRYWERAMVDLYFPVVEIWQNAKLLPGNRELEKLIYSKFRCEIEINNGWTSFLSKIDDFKEEELRKFFKNNCIGAEDEDETDLNRREVQLYTASPTVFEIYIEFNSIVNKNLEAALALAGKLPDQYFADKVVYPATWIALIKSKTSEKVYELIKDRSEIAEEVKYFVKTYHVQQPISTLILLSQINDGVWQMMLASHEHIDCFIKGGGKLSQEDLAKMFDNGLSDLVMEYLSKQN